MTAIAISPQFLAAAVVTLSAIIVYIGLGFRVAGARSKFKIKAPATTGDLAFERIFRTHYNTLEQLLVLIPGVWIFSYLVSAQYALVLGLVWVLSRVIYAIGYGMGNFILHEIGSTLGYFTSFPMVVYSLYVAVTTPEFKTLLFSLRDLIPA